MFLNCCNNRWHFHPALCFRLWQQQKWWFWNRLKWYHFKANHCSKLRNFTKKKSKSKHFELVFGRISNIANLVLFLAQKIIKIEEIWTHCSFWALTKLSSMPVIREGLHLSFCASCGKLRSRHCSCKLGAAARNLFSNCFSGFTCLAGCGIASEKIYMFRSFPFFCASCGKLHWRLQARCRQPLVNCPTPSTCIAHCDLCICQLYFITNPQ